MNRSDLPAGSGIRLQHRVKGHTRGLDKARPPAETVADIKRRFAGIDLEIVRDVVRIDQGRLDIPVFVCRAGKDSRLPSPKTMGKGPTPEQSEASALMEMVERFSHAHFPRPETCVRGTRGDLRGDAIPPAELFRVPDRAAAVSDDHRQAAAALPFSWVPAYSLADHRDVWMPYEWFADVQGTNGLSAGNTMEETVLQGLCEVVERHVCARVNAERRPVPAVDLASVRDPVARELLDKFFRSRIRLVCLDFSLDTGIPTVAGIALDPATYPNSEIVYCAGTATAPEKALIRVLTEIQQMAVDDFRQDYYEGGILPKFRSIDEFAFLFDEGEPVAIQTLPDVSDDDLLAEVENCTRCLQRIGFEPRVVNLMHPLLQIPAVFVIVAGSELYEMSTRRLGADYFLGRQLKFAGDLDAAEARFRKALDAYPESALHCTFELAECRMRRRDWQPAMDLFKQASFQRPDRVMQMRIFQALQICAQKRTTQEGESTGHWTPGSRKPVSRA